jgi:5'-phosphate synthase pdxT subunit
VFIRAPWIESAGPDVEILVEHDGHAVAARSGNLLVTAFHPELGDELRFHEWLVSRARERRGRIEGVDRREGNVRAQ